MCHLMVQLNRLEHTLLCFRFLKAHISMRRQQDNSNSRAQECEGHVLSTKTLRSHITGELHCLMHV